MHTKKKTLLWSFSNVWGKEGKQIHVTCFPFSAVVMLFSISLFFFFTRVVTVLFFSSSLLYRIAISCTV